MIEYPTIEHPVWNPLLSYQFAKTNQGVPCIMLNYIGETGEKTTLIFEELPALRATIDMMQYGLDMLEAAQSKGFEGTLEAFGGDPAPAAPVPDDISSLFKD